MSLYKKTNGEYLNDFELNNSFISLAKSILRNEIYNKYHVVYTSVLYYGNPWNPISRVFIEKYTDVDGVSYNSETATGFSSLTDFSQNITTPVNSMFCSASYGKITTKKVNSGEVVSSILTLYEYSPMALFDDHSGGSIDSARWTASSSGSGSTYQTGGYLYLVSGAAAGTSIATANGSSSSLDLNNEDIDYYLYNYLVSTNSSTTIYAVFCITDGTNEVIVGYNHYNSGSWGTGGTYTTVIELDHLNKRARSIALNGGNQTPGKWVDLSSLGSNWYPRFKAVTNAATGYDFRIYDEYYTTTNPQSTITISASADNGSTFTTVTNGYISSMSVAGSAISTKIEFTQSNDEGCLVLGNGFIV